MTTERPPIIMYARERFCPDVTRSRLRLDELGLEWTEYDIESDDARKQEMVELSGRPNVPTIVIGKSILVEPTNDILDEALVNAGYELDEDA